MAPLGLEGNFLKVLPIVAIESYLFYLTFGMKPRECQVVLAVVGLWWCWAALLVEIQIEKAYPHFNYENPVDPEMTKYKPFCDFAPWATCSKVLMSPPGRFLKFFGIAKERHGFFFDKWSGDGMMEKFRGAIDIPNPTLGVIFFGFHLIFPVLMVLPFPILNKIIAWVFFGACCGVGAMTIWLAYNLFFVLKDFCVVCVSMYVANFFLIPMMFRLAMTNIVDVSADEGFLKIFTMENFFGDMPIALLGSLGALLALDALMGCAAIFLYFCTGVKAREADEDYRAILA
mmetsp:Transcript_142669/g.248781  ORF Transcript_142669/g.248781 Transcript_142669/m.248781 type:complete len:287 (-) Transcript_142669:205-1065(-)